MYLHGKSNEIEMAAKEKVTTKILDEAEKFKLRLLMNSTGKTQEEIADILKVTAPHLCSALPKFSDKGKKKAERPNVPLQWKIIFEQHLEIERLRANLESMKQFLNEEK